MLWEAEGQLRWQRDVADLPAFELLHQGPWHYPPEAHEPRLETDPWSIVGNYGLTLFPHASGSYQLLHTERGFVRLNHDGSERVTGRACRSRLRLDGVDHDLLDGSAVARFGCGWACWQQRRDGIQVQRDLITAPSQDAADRIPAAIVEIRLRNEGAHSRELHLEEGIGARFHVANWCNPPQGRQLCRYPVSASIAAGHARAAFHPAPETGLVFDGDGLWAQADARPALLQLSSSDAVLEQEPIDEEGVWLLARWSLRLQPGEERCCRVIVGWSDPEMPWSRTLARIDRPVAELQRAWAERLPSFDTADDATGGELQWHAYVLHAMATWDTRYGCTFIPQGTLYEYGVGVAAVTRDHAMHALPACSYDPDLARSVLRYLCRHTEPTGRIQHTDEGAGLVPLGCDQKSDNQLFALLLLVEYLERSGDLACLDERDPFFPCGCSASGTVLDRVARWVRYLRDVVHVGANGLVRILFSDISDTLHHAFDHLRYPQVFNGESHVNTGLAIHVLDRLVAVLGAHAPAAELVRAAGDHAAALRRALDRELDGRSWCPRGRVGDEVLGDDDAFCMPQAFLIGDPKRDPAQRQAIWQAVKPRIWDDEPFGVRLREGAGRHRCGMVWYAWSGHFISNLMTIDPAAAREGFERLSLRRRAEREPRQWIGLWSQSDITWAYQGSTQTPGTTRIAYVAPFPHFCAHAHAWPLQIWLQLQREDGSDR